MKTIVGPRGTGKTERLLKMAAVAGGIVVVPTPRLATHAELLAKKLGLDVEVQVRGYLGGASKPLFIDNVQQFIALQVEHRVAAIVVDGHDEGAEVVETRKAPDKVEVFFHGDLLVQATGPINGSPDSPSPVAVLSDGTVRAAQVGDRVVAMALSGVSPSGQVLVSISAPAPAVGGRDESGELLGLFGERMLTSSLKR